MKYYIFIIFICITLESIAQKTDSIDDILYKCKYRVTYQIDSTDSNSFESEEMLLLIGKKTSKFQSIGGYLRDSISGSFKKQTTSSLNLLTLFKNLPKTKFKEKIFKNYPEEKITYTEKIFKDNFRYLESLNLFNWKIESKKEIISGYNCQKASVNYAGRKYTAWFTNEIPISDGPYKFNGLPGLIVKISDSKNQYTYELISLKRTIGNRITINDKNYITIEKAQFVKIKKEFYANIFKKLEQSGITLNFDNPSQKRDLLKKYNKRNNPIELVNGN